MPSDAVCHACGQAVPVPTRVRCAQAECPHHPDVWTRDGALCAAHLIQRAIRLHGEASPRTLSRLLGMEQPHYIGSPTIGGRRG